MISLLVLLLGCSSPAKPDIHFTEEGQALLISESEIPSGWHSEGTFSIPMRTAEDRGITFKPEMMDPFLLQNTLIHQVTVFRQEEVAVKFFEESYEFAISNAEKITISEGIDQEDFTPPQKYTYKSPIADDFKVIYIASKGMRGPVLGYHYHVLARYGNVISELSTIVEDEEQTGIKAEEANLMPWVEVERLLQLIDKKFQAVGF